MRRPLRRPLTLRARLTVLYGALFTVAGALLLGLTYVLFLSQIDPLGDRVLIQDRPRGDSVESGDPAGWPTIRTMDGEVMAGADAQAWLDDQQESLRDAAASSLLVQGGIALVLVGGVAAGSGWLLAGRVLAPLHRVTATAHRISTAPAAELSLHERIALDGPDDEVKELADAFDSMVERLERSFNGQRRFVANASHELRTPLTVGRALIELALRRPGAPPELQHLGADLLELNTRHEAMIAGLLDLAGADNGPVDHQAVDIADIVDHVLDMCASEAAALGITVESEVSEATVVADARLVERLVSNLVENGIRHNVPGGWVRVRCRTVDDRAELSVSNTGPSVPLYEIPTIVQPFRRLGDTRLVGRGGAGLGLSIVDSIVRAHDGSLDVEPRAEGGLDVTVVLAADGPGDAGETPPPPPGQRWNEAKGVR